MALRCGAALLKAEAADLSTYVSCCLQMASGICVCVCVYIYMFGDGLYNKLRRKRLKTILLSSHNSQFITSFNFVTVKVRLTVDRPHA